MKPIPMGPQGLTVLGTILKGIGRCRAMHGPSVLHVGGHSTFTLQKDGAWRRRVVERALDAVRVIVGPSNVLAVAREGS